MFRCLCSKFISRIGTIALVFFVSMIMAVNVYASHFRGGDITFRTDPNTGEVVVNLCLYRDCSGITFGTTAPITVRSASTGLTLNITANQLGCTDVSSYGANCNIVTTCTSTTSPNPGVQRCCYEARVTLPRTATDWVFEHEDCCRNGGLNLIPNEGSYVISALFNNVAVSQNNNVTFSEGPTPYICANQEVTFSPGATDIDGDSLVFNLVPARQSSVLNFTYLPGQSADTPMYIVPGRFSFCRNTGQLTMWPIAGQGPCVIAIRVDEYRNGVLIAQTYRDMQIIIINCANSSLTTINPPVDYNVVSNSIFIRDNCGSTGNSGGTFNICKGQALSFRQRICNTDTTLRLSVNSNVATILPNTGAGVISVPDAGASWDTTVTPRRRVFCYNAIVSLPVVNQTVDFILKVEDLGTCPIPRRQYIGFKIFVSNVRILAPDTVKFCAGIDQNRTFTAFSNSLLPGRYRWRQVSGQPINVIGSNTNSITVNMPASLPAGVYPFECQFLDTLCAVKDTVYLQLGAFPINVSATASSRMICGNGRPDTVSVTAIPLPGAVQFGMDGVYRWTSSNYPATVFTSPYSQTTNAIVAGRVPAIYNVQYTYGQCVGTGSVSVKFDTSRITVTPPTASLCVGQPARFVAFVTSDTVTRVNRPTVYLPAQSVVRPAFPVPATGSTLLTLGDDATSVVPITFPFIFYGAAYSTVAVSSNGFISFTTTTGAGCCSGQTLPNNPVAAPNNLIALSWEDLAPNNGGTIRYWVQGTAPNRQFVVDFNSVPFFGAAGTVTGQIVLFETTGQILIIHTNINSTSTTNTITAGIESGVNGTTYIGAPVAVPGFNAQNGTAVNQSWSFRPDVYTIPSPVTYTWPDFNVNNDTLNMVGQVTRDLLVVSYNPVTRCSISTTARVTVGGDLPAPVAAGCSPTSNSVNFQWNAVTGATAYEVSLDTFKTAPLTVTGTNFSVTGLTSGECRTIAVRAIGGPQVCGNTAEFFRCCASDCMQLSARAIDANCFGVCNGSVVLTATNATAPITYRDSISGASNTTGTFNNLCTGNYVFRATDASGCIDRVEVQIATVTAITATAVTIPETCNANGQARLSAIGGLPPYTYIWENLQTTQSATNLATGDRQFTVTDVNGCSKQGFVFVPYNGPGILITPVTDTVCPGQSVALLATAISSPTSIGCSLATSPCVGSVSTLTVGTGSTALRTLAGTPFNGFYEASRNQYLYTAAELTAAGLKRGNIKSIGFNVANKRSTLPYKDYTIKLSCTTAAQLSSYQGQMYMVHSTPSLNTVAGVNTFNFSNDFFWDGISNLLVEVCFTNTAGQYSQADYTRGSTTSFVSTLSFELDRTLGCNIVARRPMTTRPNAIFTNCSTTTYTWAANATLSNTTGAQTTATPTAPFVTYTVTTNDGNCPVSNTVSIVVRGALPAPSGLTCTALNASSLAYSWTALQNAVNGYEVSVNNGAWRNVSATTAYTVTGLPSNTTVTFSLRARGARPACPNGIATTTCATLPCFQTTVTPVASKCYNGSSGQITVSMSGSGPYSLRLLQAGNVQVATGSTGNSPYTFSNLTAGQYSVEITDATLGCYSVYNTTVSQPTYPMAIVGTPTPATCSPIGTATAAANGGLAPYTYRWSTGGTAASITGLSAGTYSVTATDANACSVASSLVIQALQPLPNAQLGNRRPTCTYSIDGQVSLTNFNYTGSIVPTFQWTVNGAAATPTNNLAAFSNLRQGDVVAVTISVPGCPATSATTTVPSAPTLTLTVDRFVNPCIGSNIGQITVSSNQNVTFAWSNGGASNTINGLGANKYDVTATNSEGCTATIAQTLTAIPIPIADIRNNVTAGAKDTVFASIDQNVVLTASPSAEAGVTYTWSPTTNFLAGVSAQQYAVTANAATEQTYTYTVTAVNGACSATDVIVFVSQPSFESLANFFSPDNDQINDTYGPTYKGTQIQFESFHIFNRFGQVIFKSSNINERWDGKFDNVEQPREVYIAVFKYYKFENGVKTLKTLSSDFTLIR